MFLLFAEQAGEASEHIPAVVQWVNSWAGEPLYRFEIHYTKPVWDWFFGKFGTTPEKVFGAEYSPENAVPWYTVMFIIAVLLTFVVIIILKPRKLSADEPTDGQTTLEAGVLAIRNLLVDNIGPHGTKYLPVIATFGMLILISNMMGLVPGLMAPTSATSVTFALGLTSFVYYNSVGIRENGLVGHLKHFAGPIPWLAALLFPIELISNFVRPMSLGIRLFGNLFGDEQILGTIGGLASNIFAAIHSATGIPIPAAPWLLPVLIMPLSLFVAFMQTFIFVILSIIYISEVSHAPHGEHHGEDDVHKALENGGGVFTLPEHA